jgi:hypothetical protein
MSAAQNSHNPHSVVVYLGSLTADTSTALPAWLTPRKVEIKRVSLLNQAAVAASDTDYVQVSLKSGSTVIAELDSREAHEDGLAANTKEELNLVAAEAERAADDVLLVDYQETGTVQLTNAVLVIDYEVKGQVA